MPPSLGWMVQPSLFALPPDVEPGSWDLANTILATDERHVELVLRAGFDTLWVEDHMGWGDRSHLECVTTLAWLAGRHPGPRFGTMVFGQAFRNPAYLAKLSVNLQLLTGERFILGIGAGNNGGEHAEFGFSFPPPGERLDQTEEAILIIRALLRGGRQTFDGRHYRIRDAVVAPTPGTPIPLMIGGGGERRTLRLVAQYADWWCADIGDVSTFSHKSAVLAGHCRDVGRDPASVVRSQVTWIGFVDGGERPSFWPNVPIVAGTEDEITRELLVFRAAGVDHFQIRFMDFPSADGAERFIDRILPRLRESWP